MMQIPGGRAPMRPGRSAGIRLGQEIEGGKAPMKLGQRGSARGRALRGLAKSAPQVS